MDKKINTITGNGNGLQAAPHEPVSYLAQDYERWKRLYSKQPALDQRFLESQAQALANGLLQNLSQIEFRLPDEVIGDRAGSAPAAGMAAESALRIPKDDRDQMIGGLMDRLTRSRLNIVLRQRLDELEASSNAGVATGAGLIRYATAMFLVSNMLPEGRTVEYQALEGEEIASAPVSNPADVNSAITAETDAIAEETGEGMEPGRGSLQTPFVPAARRFYLPQWVALDENDHLLVGSLSEAEAHIASMQRFLRVLHVAVSVAAYMVADETYQRKRYGMLGQLVNQGRALARYETRQIIATIRRRALTNSLNRGLSLSLPYFDDQTLEMKVYSFQIIPAGRIMFVPAFVVRACHQEEVKIAQDTRLDQSTRRHLLSLLELLTKAFEPADER
jgi:hypothetical protein